jgi:hypothetical protein
VVSVKKMLNLLLAASVALSLLTGFQRARAAFDDYVDVDGHWARDILEKAYGDGLIVGYGNSLSPDGDISAAQVLTILCRMLGAEDAAGAQGMGLGGGEWYYSDVAKAAYLGILSPADAVDFNAPMSRRDAFHMLAEAFQLVDAKPDMAKLDSYPDAGALTGAKRKAWASLVSKGIVQGIDGKLAVDNKTTRAEFLAVAYRIADRYMPASGFRGNADSGVVLHGSARISGSTFGQGVWFGCASTDISLRDVKASSAVIRSHSLATLAIEGATHIGRLVLAAQSGDITLAPGSGAVVDKLVVGIGKGITAVQGVGAVEVDRKSVV